jgi:hypothetical protein
MHVKGNVIMVTTTLESSENSVFEVDRDNTVPNISAAERALLRAAAEKHNAGFDCINCGYACKFGELSCPKCQTLFASGGKTEKLNDQETRSPAGQKWPIGEVFVEAQQTLTLQIDSQTLVLPTQDSLIIGRVSEIPGDSVPDINLSTFEAKEQGVSRQHLKITRVRDMVYVTDLGSSNGTYLNGHRLAPNISRLLRDGDALRLGHLRMRVSFSG